MEDTLRVCRAFESYSARSSQPPESSPPTPALTCLCCTNPAWVIYRGTPCVIRPRRCPHKAHETAAAQTQILVTALWRNLPHAPPSVENIFRSRSDGLHVRPLVATRSAAAGE